MHVVKPTSCQPQRMGALPLGFKCSSTLGSQAVPPRHWLSWTGAQLVSSAGDSDNGDMVCSLAK